MASIMYDGFDIQEAAEVCIYPQYDEAGGLDSERVFVKQLVQKHVVVEGVSDELFEGDQESISTEEYAATL
jgi:hypothetical protein